MKNIERFAKNNVSGYSYIDESSCKFIRPEKYTESISLPKIEK